MLVVSRRSSLTLSLLRGLCLASAFLLTRHHPVVWELHLQSRPSPKQTKNPLKFLHPKLPLHLPFVYLTPPHQPVLLFCMTPFTLCLFKGIYLRRQETSACLSVFASSLRIGFFLKRQMVSERSHPSVYVQRPGRPTKPRSR